MTTSTLPPMPVNVKTAPPVSVTVDGGSLGIAGVGVVYNVAVPTANTEQLFSIPDGTKSLEVKTRGNSSLKLSLTAGTSGTAYVEVGPGNSYNKDMLNTVGMVIYFQTPNAPEVVQIIVYS